MVVEALALFFEVIVPWVGGMDKGRSDVQLAGGGGGRFSGKVLMVGEDGGPGPGRPACDRLGHKPMGGDKMMVPKAKHAQGGVGEFGGDFARDGGNGVAGKGGSTNSGGCGLEEADVNGAPGGGAGGRAEEMDGSGTGR